jgi:hypothetical protein
MRFNLPIRIVLAWVALAAAQMVAGLLIPVAWPGAEKAFAWALFTNLLVVAALAYVAARADLRGWKVGVALAGVPCAIAVPNMIEGAIFLKTNLPWGRIFLQMIVAYALAAPAWSWIFSQRRDGIAHFCPVGSKTMGSRVWRFVASDFSYVVLYFIAGSIIFPFVRDFYATQTVPPFQKIVALQLLVRGPIFIAICLLLVRLLGMERLTGALTVGLVFTLISGVAPLLPPNPIFPDAVRWAHFGEVVSSNFIFGAFVAWLWGRPSEGQPAVLATAA